MLRSLTRLGAALALAGLLLPQDAVSAPVPKREIAPLPASKTALVPFEVTPFPYRGEVPDKNRPFLDVADGERHGHSTVRGGTYWEDQTYSDQRVLLHIPKGFDPRRPALMVVFFHGNEATLERDVRNRQAVPRQITESGLNVVLVAPQFAVNALDSSAGRFWEPGVFAQFLREAGDRLAQLYGDGRARLEILFETPRPLDEWSCQVIDDATQLAAMILELERATGRLMNGARRQADGAAPLIGSRSAS